MDPVTLIPELEAAGKRVGKSVDDLCRAVPVDRATWQRWKAGRTQPRLGTWNRLNAIYQDLKQEAA